MKHASTVPGCGSSEPHRRIQQLRSKRWPMTPIVSATRALFRVEPARFIHKLSVEADGARLDRFVRFAPLFGRHGDAGLERDAGIADENPLRRRDRRVE